MTPRLLLLSAAAILAAPPAALAQSAEGPAAAATLPNTFDAPAAARPAPASAAPTSSPAVVAAAEAMLRKTVAAIQAGEANYADMSPDLAGKVRERAAEITPLIQSFGALQSVSHAGTENGAELFLVTFANQPTQWIIALNQGKIVALLFRPAT